MATAGKTIKAELLKHLRHAILTQALAPGADLDEASLSEQWELSRTPLRDVLRQLAGEGYVEIRENRGARVTEMTHRSLHDFFMAAPMIYGAILRLAAHNATPTQIEVLKSAQLTFKTALRGGDIAARALANNRFHEITGDMAGNTYLMPSFQRLLIDHARISMTFFHPRDQQNTQNLDTASQQHDAIIAAIEAGDAEAAGDLAVQHWNLSRNNIELFVTPKGLDLPLGLAMPA
ncbi:Transcriptional regulator, GntR family [Sulfitobacter noctilucicola]|uniref:DNA-binding GntR family transcriptional regulator n=1 Tax=Sulfitobacter noctilucicola TaxID=1342301 RepID=A0A7W6Q614_9RHOB|nr:GntR family transcriptional regulator [Sulfitobacter noctilucicola]KIN64458.1 Transcriptional regulator, GntR family [Sulfitobacter noctilucicola]MBB4174382.1 DNA-binding GntR family transcriptional regulator [Sulfitobacter noctilucicola]